MSFGGEVPLSYVNEYLAETSTIAAQIDPLAIEILVDMVAVTREAPGVVYVLGLGGSLTNAAHLAADLMARADAPAEAPESVGELTAWANDCGWDQMFVRWLARRLLTKQDMVLVLSVGGGNVPTGVSRPLVNALHYAKELDVPTAGIVGEPGGVTGAHADVVVKIPTVHPARKTEHCEGWQGVLHHLIVSHPRLRRAP